jgi:hypothetical protein
MEYVGIDLHKKESQICRVSAEVCVGAERRGGPPERGATVSSSARRREHDAARLA